MYVAMRGSGLLTGLEDDYDLPEPDDDDDDDEDDDDDDDENDEENEDDYDVSAIDDLALTVLRCY